MPRRCRGWRASAMRCGWSSRSAAGPASDLDDDDGDRLRLGRRRRSEAALVRPPLGAAGRRDRGRGRGLLDERQDGREPHARRARRWSTRSAASFARSPGSSSAKPAQAPSGSPGRRPIRSSFRRRACASSLPSRCAAKIRLLAVTPEPQLATNGCAGSIPASANSRAQLVRRLEACRPHGRASRTAGCARRECGPPRRRGAGRARCLRSAALPRASSSGAPSAGEDLLLGDDLVARSCGVEPRVARLPARRFRSGGLRRAISGSRRRGSRPARAPKWRSMNQPRAAVRIGELS